MCSRLGGKAAFTLRIVRKSPYKGIECFRKRFGHNFKGTKIPPIVDREKKSEG